MIPDSIKELIDRKFMDGHLPLEEPKVVYGGLCEEAHPCAGCDQPIHPRDTELETIAVDGRVRYYHPPCGQYAAQARVQLRSKLR